MKTKKAIRFLNKHLAVFKAETKDTELKDKRKELIMETENVIALLQQGEKYRLIVWEINNERLSDEYDPIYGIPNRLEKSIHQRIKTIIEKYFPVEETYNGVPVSKIKVGGTD